MRFFFHLLRHKRQEAEEWLGRHKKGNILEAGGSGSWEKPAPSFTTPCLSFPICKRKVRAPATSYGLVGHISESK